MTTSRRAKRALCILSFAALSTALGPPARAQSPEELRAARELFQDAYKDEQDRRYAEALEKFQRVSRVRESASVRYRIASVLEALGRLRESRDAFRALAARKNDLEKKEQEIADSAAERAAGLDEKIPKLVVRTEREPAAGTRVTIDGAEVPASTHPRAIELDPGEHVVQSSAPGARPFATKVRLGEGGQMDLTVPVEAAPAAVPPPRPEEPPPPPPPPSSDRTVAYVAVAAGSVLLVSGVVLLIIRESDIADIRSKCPSGVCAVSQRNVIESDRDQAKLFGPLGFGLAAAGLALGAAGVYLLVKAPRSSAAPPTIAPTSPPVGALRFAPHVVRGGAILGIGAGF